MSMCGQFFIFADDSSDASYAALVGCAKVIVILLVAAAGLLLLRRWLKRDDQPQAPAGFTLHDLRQLRDSGQMSKEEYDRALGKMSAAARRDSTANPQSNLQPKNPDGTRRIPPQSFF